jgi:hypothetical protein
MNILIDCDSTYTSTSTYSKIKKKIAREKIIFAYTGKHSVVLTLGVSGDKSTE